MDVYEELYPSQQIDADQAMRVVRYFADNLGDLDDCVDRDTALMALVVAWSALQAGG